MRFLAILLCLSLWTSTVFAQRIRMPDLLHCLSAPVDKFDACMFREGFVCYKSSGGLTGWTCLFAYQPTPFRQNPVTASGLIQYDRNSRSDILTYQVRSKEQYTALQGELIQLGYQIEPVLTDRKMYIKEDTVVTCQKAGTTAGMSGNYEGYLVTLTRRRY